MSDHLKRRWSNLFWQPLIGTIFICLVLFVMNHLAESDVLWAVGAGSLSSSCFIVFGKPSSSAAVPRKIFGGYVIGIVCGVLLHVLTSYFHNFDLDFLATPHFHVIGIIASLATGLCLFFMSVLKLDHPPAAGMALVLVLDMKDYDIIFVVLIAAIILGLIRYFLCHRLVDLI